jgi:hypothetical protein
MLGGYISDLESGGVGTGISHQCLVPAQTTGVSGMQPILRKLHSHSHRTLSAWVQNRDAIEHHCCLQRTAGIRSGLTAGHPR